jgi:hypothetical protein
MRKAPNLSEYRIGMLEREVISLTRQVADKDAQIAALREGAIALVKLLVAERLKKLPRTPLLPVADPGILKMAGGCEETRSLLSHNNQQADNEGKQKC